MAGKEHEPDHPIPGPTDVNTHHPLEFDPDAPLLSTFDKVQRVVRTIFKYPAEFVREKIVLPNKGEKYYWYHRRYPRAVPIDECYTDDLACVFEANLEFRRGYMVDRMSLDLLRYRYQACVTNFITVNKIFDVDPRCKPLKEVYDENELNFHIKYADMKHNFTATDAYMKQKHRMIMERRQALREQAKKEGQLE